MFRLLPYAVALLFDVQWVLFCSVRLHVVFCLVLFCCMLVLYRAWLQCAARVSAIVHSINSLIFSTDYWILFRGCFGFNSAVLSPALNPQARRNSARKTGSGGTGPPRLGSFAANARPYPRQQQEIGDSTVQDA